MWLINSPIGRKVVMSLTGICLILFLTFHCCMNVAAFFSGHAYNMVCEFLGSNWYAVLGTLGLAFLAVCHIVYAFILTAQNRRARGPQRYEVTSRRPEVSWASQNMLVLGLIIVVGLLLHLYNFWAHMMLAELAGCATTGSRRWLWLDSGDILQPCLLCALSRVDRGPVVPPLSWLLVSNADLGLERQDLAEALAVHRHRLCHHPHGRVRLPGIVILVWFRAQLLIVDSKYSF